MPEHRNESVLETYQKLKGEDRLSVNLLNPTTANLRNECIVIYSLRPNERIKLILSGFGIQLSNAEDIRRIDPDKFRPLRNFMIGEIENPNIQTIELLRWLINYKTREPQLEPINAKWYEQKNFHIGALVIAAFVIIYFLLPKKQCMYWDGRRYQQISCDGGAKSYLKVTKLDRRRLEDFEKITEPDTLGSKDIGRVWYMKIDDVPNFFTDSGMHPVEEKLQLKPITKYIVDKYIFKKDTAVNTVTSQM